MDRCLLTRGEVGKTFRSYEISSCNVLQLVITIRNIFQKQLRLSCKASLVHCAVTSALPEMEMHKGGARELWATASPQPRSGPVVWMGDPDEFAAVTSNGLPSSLRSPSPDSEGRWDRQELKAKNRRQLGKKSECGGKGKGGKGKKEAACEPWECVNGKLNGIGSDYDGNVAQTASGKACRSWTSVTDASGWKWANYYYGFTDAEQK